MNSSTPARFEILGGMNTMSTPDTIQPGSYSYLQNTRRNLAGRIEARPPLGANLLASALPAGATSLLRMNDTTPAGPVSGYVLVIGAAGIMYVNAASVKTGLSGSP